MSTSLSGAIHDAVGKLVRAFVEVVGDDQSSPLRAGIRMNSPPGKAASMSSTPPRSVRPTSPYSPGTD
jgi:hypothetical protein